jgi:peptide deformylase
MVREIVRDVMFLSRKSDDAAREDLPTARDLLETLKAHSEECVGMAANMIGVTKRIIAVQTGKEYLLMINPIITDKSRKSYETNEGCLCHTGERPCTRFESITVEFKDKKFKRRTQTFSGFTAQIIQHEIDHCNGIII